MQERRKKEDKYCPLCLCMKRNQKSFAGRGSSIAGVDFGESTPNAFFPPARKKKASQQTQ
jgi:hypothetical protein